LIFIVHGAGEGGSRELGASTAFAAASQAHVLNHTNLSDPNLCDLNLDISSSNFGTITTACGSDVGGSRTGQLSMRLDF
jgi:hypothetical protein